MKRHCVAAAGVAAAIAIMAACGGDQSTNTTPTPLTSAQLALHFDTLAGQLAAVSPGDPRLNWYQDIASILARGVSPTAGQMHVAGGPAVFETATEVDAFADSLGGKKIADSTYRLAAWGPATHPTQFLDVRVRFVPPKSGTTDTTVTYITFYGDTTSNNIFTDTTEVASLQLINNRGLCQITALQHLTVPSNPCTKVAVDWLVGGGSNLLVIDPQAQVSGTHLTQ